MAELKFDDASIPRLDGKVAIVTGASSGIGLAAARIMIEKGAVVHNLDVQDVQADGATLDTPNFHTHRCDVSVWTDLRDHFDSIGPADLVFANASVTEKPGFFEDSYNDAGQLQEPQRKLNDVNWNGVLFTVKLAWHSMRLHKKHGSIVITTSATAYAPEQSLPVYAGGKAAITGLIRALRSTMIADGITINGVAPAATLTGQLPPHLAAPIVERGLPISAAHFVGMALVYAATASQDRRVEPYGRETEASKWCSERWNGRVILTLGETYTELEEPLSDLRQFWLGHENLRLTRLQQSATDFRPSVGQDATYGSSDFT